MGLLVVLVAGAALLVPFLFPPLSDNMTLGQRQRVANQTVPAGGGTIVVDAPGDPIDGLTLTVPDGAYAGGNRFKISTRPIEAHDLGPHFEPVTPLIHIENDGEFASAPLEVEVPIQIAPDEFAMAFYYDVHTGELEGIPVADLTTDRLTLVTSHFSDFVISKIPLYLLESVAVDTGFQPGVDDWQFTNYGSYLARRGHCAGQAVSAMWYYYEQRLGRGEPPLYGRFDNNAQDYLTPGFQADDSWGYRFASVVQKELIDWDHSSRTFFKSMGQTSDQLTWASFAYAMLQTGEPQYVAIYSASGGHAIVAYKIEEQRIYVADPNYPGVAGRVIRFEGGEFLPYYSGANATTISEEGETAYVAIRYMAKSAMSNWEAIGTEYKRMRQGKSGAAQFPAYTLEYLSDVDETTGEEIWTPLPELLELTEEETAAPGEAYRGKLVLRLKQGTVGEFAAFLYDGTTEVESKKSGTLGYVTLTYPLKPGVHDVGVELDDYEAVDQNKYRLHYIDFRRVKLIYEPGDLTGTWDGVWQVTSADKVLRVIEDVLVRIVMLFGVEEQEARDAAAAAIEQDPSLYNERALTLVLEPVDPDRRDRYHVQVTMEGDPGVVNEYTGEATFREGVLTFEFPADGGRSTFTGSLTEEDVLSGDFTVLAWGFVKDALVGNWRVARR